MSGFLTDIFQRLGAEAGRETNWLSDNLLGFLPDSVSRDVSSYLNPLSYLTGGLPVSDYYSRRQDGASPESAFTGAGLDLGKLGLAGLFAGAFGGAPSAISGGATPSFFEPVPSIGGTGLASFATPTGYLAAGQSAVPSIAGTTAADFGMGGGTSFLENFANSIAKNSISGKGTGQQQPNYYSGGFSSTPPPESLDVTKQLLDQLMPIIMAPRNVQNIKNVGDY